ncbi:MAG: magnesium transporter CorA family protein [Nibricoccus sp.]
MITSLVYRDHKLVAQDPSVEELAILKAEPGVLMWVDLSDPSNEEVTHILEKLFAFHPLAIEDCLSDSLFPKLEAYDDHIYFVMHAIDTTDRAVFKTTELDLFLGKNYLVTFHRKPLTAVTATQERYLRQNNTVVRGPDRFAHAILDNMVEAYKPALESLRREIDAIEEGVLHEISADELFPKVVALRKQLASLRQLVRPQREIAIDLAQGKTGFIRSNITPYLRDLAEELGRVETQTQAWAEQLILSFRIFLNKSSSVANAGIRVLTAITALTFPALLVGGWFGMNFAKMPELGWTSGYPFAFGLMLAGTFATYLFMRRKKWL